MALFDLLGRRWALGIIWNVCEHGPLSFRALQSRCNGLSPSVLNTRLKELREAGLIAQTASGYAATDACGDLFELLRPMRPWAHDWAKSFNGAE